VIRRRPLAKEVRQSAPANEPHDEKGGAVHIAAHLMDRDDPGMLELSRDLRLGDEPLLHSGMRRMAPKKDLHRDVAPDRIISPVKYDSDAAASDLAEDAETTDRLRDPSFARPGRLARVALGAQGPFRARGRCGTSTRWIRISPLARALPLIVEERAQAKVEEIVGGRAIVAR